MKRLAIMVLLAALGGCATTTPPGACWPRIPYTKGDIAVVSPPLAKGLLRHERVGKAAGCWS